MTPLLEQGFNLMLFGMGTVFVFLTVLVFGMMFMSAIIQRFFAIDDTASSVPADLQLSPVQPVNEKTLKIIQAAITKHRHD